MTLKCSLFRTAILSAALLAIPALASAQSCPTGVTHCTILSWTAGVCPTGATCDPTTGYHIWRAQNSCAAIGTPGQAPLQSAPYATVASPTTLTFTDTAVAAGQDFCYAVTAYNLNGTTVQDSPLSAEVSAVTPFSVPLVPTGLSVVAK